MYIYPWQITLLQSSIDALNTATPILAHLMAEQCTYTYGRLTPLSIEHRCLEYHYTNLGRSIYIEQCIYTHGRLPPLQSSIDALNTATPILEHLMAEQCTYTYGRWAPC